ncbi:methyltransferase [Vibrio lentus]|nr:methyltransferase [Vibrio lentus]PMJ82386.1 methyltransferase [Vibrio lentus]PMM54260.1 methyltransferase [Vibrio lentus]PMN59319.1 methyltransferase [Vibrio lentus]
MAWHDAFNMSQEFFWDIYVSVQKGISVYSVNARSLKQNEIVLNQICFKQ